MSNTDNNKATIYLGHFVDCVRSYRETGDEDDALQASEYHARVCLCIRDGNEPDWKKHSLTREEFQAYIQSGYFEIKMPL